MLSEDYKAICISESIKNLNVLDSISLAIVECEYDYHICMYTLSYRTR